MKEKRKEKRWPLKNALMVYKADCKSFIGWLLNITMDGMLLESEYSIPTGKDYRFCVEIVREKVIIRVRSIWSIYDEDIEIHKTGFRFLELSSETKSKIRSLIDALRANADFGK